MTRPLIQVAEVALGRQRSPKHEQGDWMTPYLRSANVGNGFLILEDVKSMNFTPAERATFGLRDGDVLVTEGSGSRGTVGTSAVWRDEISGPVCFQNTLLRIRPRAGRSSGRYLAWWARHAHAAGLMANAAGGANILHLSAEQARRLPVPDLDIDEQGRIADFLDDQVARIENVIEARNLQTAGRVEAADLELDGLLWSNHRSIPVKYLVGRVTSGPRGWGHRVAEFGRPFFRIGNLSSRGIRLDRENLARVQVEDSAETRRATVQAGDVLIGITASLGDIGLVDERAAGGTFSQHVARLRPRGDSAEPAWLAWVLQTARVKHALTTSGYGGTKVGLGLEEVSNTAVPIRDLRGQKADAEAAAQIFASAEAARRALLLCVDRLNELKRSLITAAVTGEFDVSAADGSRVPA